jgi:hypothetical protein
MELAGEEVETGDQSEVEETKVAGGVDRIYVAETIALSEEARANPSFGRWLEDFNALVLKKNPAVESIDVYASYTDGLGRKTSPLWTEALRLKRPRCGMPR